MFAVGLVYWLHWVLDIAFVAACLSLIFRPVLLARLYVLVFLGQQLILNGCLMTWLENKVEVAAHVTTQPNHFIMEELFTGPLIWAYKVLFLVLVIWQAYYIGKEVRRWRDKNKGA